MKRPLSPLLVLLAGCALVDDPGPGVAYTTNPVYGVDISHHEGTIAFHEMECWWEAGVRHVISGTQDEEITRQQLALATRRGFSVDAYVYLYWNQDIREQVREAFRRASGFPIGRMWLDVEERLNAPGANGLAALIEEGLDECRLIGTAPCGIYTGPGFWKSFMNNMTRFADVPLWYAWYNENHDLTAWPTERFGGWLQPVGKQWAEEPLCGVGVDKDTIIPLAAPEVVIDRTPPPAPTTVPPAPVGLWPADYHRTHLGTFVLTVDSIPHADRYELKVENWRGSGWVFYVTFSSAVSFKKFSPVLKDTLYRFSARARNAHGWGPWSPVAYFEFGKYTGTRPADWGAPPPSPPPVTPSPDAAPAAPTPDAAPAAPPPDAAPVASPDAAPPPADAAPAPDPGAPVLVSPAEGATFARGAQVRLTCEPVPAADGYRFEVEYQSGGAWASYYTYTTTPPAATFYPQATSAFRWRAAARVGGAWGPWSGHRGFVVR